jgi:hypothetical protein
MTIIHATYNNNFVFGDICKLLGQDIMKQIYCYDDTYKTIFTEKVLPDLCSKIWKNKWIIWFNTNTDCKNPLVSHLVTEMFSYWGIFVNSKWKKNIYFRYFDVKEYFPEDIKIRINKIQERTYVDIYVNIGYDSFRRVSTGIFLQDINGNFRRITY